MLLKKLVIVLSLIFWPLSLYFANTPKDFVVYSFPAFLLFLCFILWQKQYKYWLLPAIFIPVISPKLALIPLIMAFVATFKQRNKSNLIVLMLSSLFFAFFIKAFWGQTVFIPDYEARQLVIRQTQLYPNVFLARLMHNKLRIILDKASDNFFALTDPNNYFFAFHPREQIVGNQNLNKFPFLALMPFIPGVFNLSKSRNYKFILLTATASAINLLVLNLFDRNDFILWLPLALIVTHGITSFQKLYPKAFRVFSYVFLVFSLIELVRIYV